MNSTNIIKNIRIFLIILLLLIVIDGFVINTLTKDVYKSELKNIAKMNGSSLSLTWWSISLVYILISFALTYYVLIPEERTNELNIFIKGSLLGFIIYGVFNFANYTLIKEWSYTLMLMDIIWGTALSGFVAFLTFYVNKLFE